MASVLIVDDETDVIEVLQDRLESYGLKVSSAESGLQALGKLSQEKFDGIFLDLRMPGMDGLTTLGEIRKTDKTTPIIVITAFSNKEAAVAAEAKGANEYLIKPFEWPDLKRKIEQTFHIAF